MKWCAPHFLSTYFTQVFETFPTHWHCKITPSQNFRLSSPPLADCHNQFWFQINYSNFTYPLQLFTKAINVHYKFSSLGKDITEYKEHFKLWSTNEVQGNTSVRKQNTLCSPFSHFQCNRSLSTYPGKQDAHLPTTEFELLCNILFLKLNQGQETTRVTWPSHSIWTSLPFPFLLKSLSWEIIHNMLRWQVGLRVVQNDWPLGETKINTAN